MRSHCEISATGLARIVFVELVLQLLQLVLVTVVVEMVLAMQVFHKIGNALYHLLGCEIMYVVLKHIANFLKMVHLIHILVICESPHKTENPQTIKS